MVVMGVTGETINEEMVAIVQEKHPHVSDLKEGGSVSWY